MSRVMTPVAVLAVLLLTAVALSDTGQTLWHALIADIAGYQRTLHRGLATAMMALSRREALSDWMDLMVLSLGYGVFHALGPGHGKAVVATYLLTHRAALPRGLIMTASAALLQGLVAIALVMVLVMGLGWLTRDAMASTVWVERASFLAVAALGAWLVYRSSRRLWSLRGSQQQYTLTPVSSVTVPPLSRAELTPAPDAVCCHCGRAHHIDPMRSGHQKREMLAAVVSIGLRPCSGGVMVLGVSAMLGFWWAGVAAVMAMALGTALSTSLLAAITVLARTRMARVGHALGSRWQLIMGHGLALLGGVFIMLMGLALLQYAPDTALSPLMGSPRF